MRAFPPFAKAADAINQALEDGRRVIAVGTTVTRTLESVGQGGKVEAGQGSTRLLITQDINSR